MGLALKLYEDLTEAPDDMARFKLVVATIDELEQRWPKANEIATKADVRESELRLLKEIEQVRSEAKISELNLKKEIEQVRAEAKVSESNLKKEIEQVRAEAKVSESNLRKEIEQLKGGLQKEIEQAKGGLQKEIQQVRVEIKATEANLRMAIHRQTLWVIGAVGAVVGLVRLLDYLLA